MISRSTATGPSCHAGHPHTPEEYRIVRRIPRHFGHCFLLLLVISAFLALIPSAGALSPPGSLAAWGSNNFGQCNVPEGNDFVDIAGGYGHSLALRSNGSVVAWGMNDSGQCSVPEGNDFIAIAAGGLHSLALRSNGSVVAWGKTDWGQCNVPAGNGFVTIAGGYGHSLALRPDGSAAGWGLNDEGQSSIPEDGEYIAVAGGGSYSLGLRSDGSIEGWGNDMYGQCDVPAGNDFVAVAAGEEKSSVAVRSDGSLAAWGFNAFGQSDVPEGNDFVAVAQGAYHSLALRSNGSAVAWGYDYDSRCDVPEGNDFIAVAGGYSHSLAIRGAGSPGVTCNVTVSVAGGHGRAVPGLQKVPANMSALTAFVHDPGYQVATITDNGETVTPSNLYLIGNITGDHSIVVTFSPDPVLTGITPVSGHSGQTLRDVNLTGTSLLSGATVKLSGTGLPDIPGTDVRVSGDGMSLLCNITLTDAAAGSRDVVVTNPSGHRATGISFFDVLPSDVTVTSLTPNTTMRGTTVAVTDLRGTNFTDGATVNLRRTGQLPIPATCVTWISANQLSCNISVPADAKPGRWDVTVTNPDGQSGSLAGGFRIAGSIPNVVAWGSNESGQCDVPEENDFTAIAGGGWDSLALRSDGSIMAWGSDADIPAGTDFIAVDTAYLHSVALRSNHSIMAWGDNEYGQCNVPAGNNFNAVSAGYVHSVALRSDGSIVAWGGIWNAPEGNDFTAVAGGGMHNVALRSDHSVVAWGDNSYFQCRVPAGNDFNAIAAGGYHSLALRSNGTIVAWGDNSAGQCDVPAGNDFDAIAAGYLHSLALRSDGTIVAWGDNSYGQCDVPAGNSYVAVDAGAYHSLAIRNLTPPGIPTITGIFPAAGHAGMTLCDVNITGTNFTAGATVNLTAVGLPNITGTGIRVTGNGTSIICNLTLAGAGPGSRDVVVTNPSGLTATGISVFTVLPSDVTVTSVIPNTSVKGATVAVTDLHGTNFTDGAAVNLTRAGQPDIPATGVTWISADQLTCSIPVPTGAVSGAWNVTVMNPDGQAGSLADGFTITSPPPAVSSIHPASGKRGKTVAITNLSGTGFEAGAKTFLVKGTAKIKGKGTTVVNETLITCTFSIPAKAAIGKWDVTMKNADGKSGVKKKAFTVKA